MNKFLPPKKAFSLFIIGMISLACCATTIAGGGGASLDKKEGLERAADNFLTAFVSLSISKNITLTPIGKEKTVLGNTSTIADFKTINEQYGSPWFFIIVRDDAVILPKSKDVSKEEYTKFKEDFYEQRRRKSDRLTATLVLKSLVNLITPQTN